MLLLLALLVGLGSGFAAVILKQCIHCVQWILTGWFNTPSDSIFYFLYPGIGMLLALLFVRYIVKDNIGHGVTKVLLAISKNESKIKPHNMWSSIASSAVTIGFGGSVGAEAPIVYTGAAIGSNVARAMGLSYKNMTILLGCGAAGAVDFQGSVGGGAVYAGNIVVQYVHDFPASVSGLFYYGYYRLVFIYGGYRGLFQYAVGIFNGKPAFLYPVRYFVRFRFVVFYPDDSPSGRQDQIRRESL